jgi:hypothetical protein
MCKNRRGGEEEERRRDGLLGEYSKKQLLPGSPLPPPLSRSYTPVRHV